MTEIDIRVIFFDLHGTLVNSAKLREGYSQRCGRLMAARHGLDAARWAAASEEVLADWDSYYADLDLEGDDGMAHLWEGMYRTTRALFRIAGVPLPDYEVVIKLAREIAVEAAIGGGALYPDAQAVLPHLHQQGYALGLTTYALVEQARGILRANGVLHHFNAPLIGPDAAEQFRKDAGFYACAVRQANIVASQGLVIDSSARALDGAKAAGLHTLRLNRVSSEDAQTGGHPVIHSLEHLPAFLQS